MPLLWNRLTIHIGMPKCASTSLQCNLFAPCKEITYLGPESVHFPANLERRHQILMTISGAEDLYWAGQRRAIREYLHRYFSPERKGVISDEGIVHGYYGAVPEGCADRRLVAERYFDLFPGAHILLVIRNQYDFLASLFAEWNRRPFISYPNYQAWIDECFHLHRNSMTTPLRLPDYLALYRLYAGMFGVERVHVVPLEGVPGIQQSLLETVAELLEIPIPDTHRQSNAKRKNTRTVSLQKTLARLDFVYPKLRKVVPRTLAMSIWALAGRLSSPLETRLSETQYQELTTFYAASNRELARSTGLPLAALGYPI